MPITAVTSDAEALTLTVVGDYPVPVERLWEAYADPRQLEKFWGPETWPATFTRHDPGLLKRWLLGPDGWTMPVCEVATEAGDAYRYEWEAEDGSGRFGFEGELLESDPPHRAVTTERMIGMDGPVAINAMTLTPLPAGTLTTLVITYPNAEVRDTALGTGMTDGMEQSYARLEREVLAAAAV